eukprot:403334613
MDSDDRMADLQQKLIDENKINSTSHSPKKSPNQDGSSSSFLINEGEDLIDGRRSSPGFNHQNNQNRNNDGNGLPKIASLADLPRNQNIDDILNPQREAEMMKPFSSRVKLVIEFDDHTKKFKISDNDKKVLENYEISQSDFCQTTQQIELNPRLRPFDRKSPFIRRVGLRLLNILVCIIFAYVALLVLQLALFNLIFLGIEIIYFKKLYYFMHGLEIKQDYNYRNSPFRRFIEAENQRFYRTKQVELVGGEQGKWLELQLPDAIEDVQKSDKAENAFNRNHIIHERLEEEDQKSERSI